MVVLFQDHFNVFFNCYMLTDTFILSVDCGPPPEITNGTVIGGVFTSVGSKASYFCDFGTNLVGNDTITCQDDGTWEDPPMCVVPGECMDYNYYALTSL